MSYLKRSIPALVPLLWAGGGFVLIRWALARRAASCPGGHCVELFDLGLGPWYIPLAAFHVAAFLLLAGGFFCCYDGYDAVAGIADSLRARLKGLPLAASLAAACALLSWFIVRFGNRQFGAFDTGPMIDAGWRLSSGQIPYRDFICTLPPGFYLGIKWAFLAFGPRWDSMLYACALFSCATFLWTFALLREILDDALPAFWIALAIQDAAMVTICFWHHNSLASISASVFFLSCFAFLKRPGSSWICASFGAALVLLGLMKPNVALPMGVSGLLLTLAATPAATPAATLAGRRLALLTLGAAAAWWAVLAANHVSPAALAASYRMVAKDRGFTVDGLLILTPPDAIRFGLCIAALLTPLIVWWPQFRQAAERRDLPALARCLLWLAGPAVACFAASTNMEMKEIEWPLLLAAGAILLLPAVRPPRPGLVRFYVCFLAALLATDFYIAATRYRIAMIGDFYEWEEPLVSPGIPFFRDMLASQNLRLTIQQVTPILSQARGSVFFGPRMEWAYAAFGAPSPAHLPVWWHPGSSHDDDQEAAILETWDNACFDTLIFLRGDFTYYSADFTELIDREYVQLPDARERSQLTVFVRKAGGCKLVR